MEKKPRVSTGVGEMFRVFDEIAFNNENTGNLKIRRSSILKVQRNSDVETYDNEVFQASGGGKSFRTKRVSFAEKFQVMELHTGNIYDIIGNKDESTPLSHSSQSNMTDEVESSCFDKSMNLNISGDLSLEPSGNHLSVTETAEQRHEDCGGDQFAVKKSELVRSESYQPQLCGSSQDVSVELAQDRLLTSENIDYVTKNAACVDGKSHKINAELPSYLSVAPTPSNTENNFHAMNSDLFLKLKHSTEENCDSLNKESTHSHGLKRNKIYSLDIYDPLNKENVFPGKKLNQMHKHTDFHPKIIGDNQFSEILPEGNSKFLKSSVPYSGERYKVANLKSNFDERYAADKENIYIGGGVNSISARSRVTDENEIQHLHHAASAQVRGFNKTNYANVPLDITLAATELSALPAEGLSEAQHSRLQINPKSFESPNEGGESCEFHSSEKNPEHFSQTKLVLDDMEITCANMDDDLVCNTANGSNSEKLCSTGKQSVQDKYSFPALCAVADTHAAEILSNNESFDYKHYDQDFNNVSTHDSPGNNFPRVFSDKSQSFLMREYEKRQNAITQANSMDLTMPDQQNELHSKFDVGSHTSECADEISKSGAVAFETPPEQINNTLYFDQNLDMTCSRNQEEYNMSLTDDFGRHTEYSCKMLEETGVKETITVADASDESSDGLRMMECAAVSEDHECLNVVRKLGQFNGSGNHQNSVFKKLSDPDHQITSDQNNMTPSEFSLVDENFKAKPRVSFIFNENLGTLESNSSERSLGLSDSVTNEHYVLTNSEAKVYSMQVPNIQGACEAQYDAQPLHVPNSRKRYQNLRTDSTPVILRSGSHTDSLKRSYSSAVDKDRNSSTTGNSLLLIRENIENVLNSNVSINAPVVKKKRSSVDLTNIDCSNSLPYSETLQKGQKSALQQQQAKAKKICKSKSFSSLPQEMTENVPKKRRRSDSDFCSKNRQRMYEDFRKEYQNLLEFYFKNMPTSMKNIDGNVSIVKPTLNSHLEFEKAKDPFKSDIMYALKRLKNCFLHPSEMNDGILKFSDLFFTLKKNPVLKPSFSCMKFQASQSIRKSFRECDWKLLEASFDAGQLEAEADNSVKDLFSTKMNQETFKGMEADEPTQNRSVTVFMVEQIELEHRSLNTSADDRLEYVSDSILHNSFESQTTSLIQANSGLTGSAFQKSEISSVAKGEPSLPLQNSRQLHESMENKNVYFFGDQVSSSIKSTSQSNFLKVTEPKQSSSMKVQTSEIQFHGNSVSKPLEESLSVCSSLNLIPQSLQSSTQNMDGSSILRLPLYSTPRLGGTSSEVHQYHVPFHKNKSTVDTVHQSPLQNSRQLQENTTDKNIKRIEDLSLSLKSSANFDGEKGIANLTSEFQFSDVSHLSLHETGKRLGISVSSNNNFVHSSSQTPAHKAPPTPYLSSDHTSNVGNISEEFQFDISNHTISEVFLPISPKCSNTSAENSLDSGSDDDDIENFIKECEAKIHCELSDEEEINVVSESCENENEEKSWEMQCSDDDDDVDARHFLRLYFEKESEKADHKWKLRSVTVNEIIFEVMLGQIYIHVPRESSGCVAGNGSNITFTYDTSDTFMDPSISELGYKLFTSHVTDTFIQLPLSPKDVVEKLQSYLKIAPIGRLFMRDIDHVSTAHDFSSSMSDDILRFSVDDVLNRNHNMKFRMIFPVNMKTYPNEKIIPDVEFIFNFCSVKKEDILCCVESIEPGEDYLYRMVQEARYFKK